MNIENKHLILIAGLFFIALSIPLAAGIISTPWSASAATWRGTEVIDFTIPEATDNEIPAGTQIDYLNVTLHNAADERGSLVIDVVIPGYPAWQFETRSMRPNTTRYFKAKFYRDYPVMPQNGSLTISVSDLWEETKVTKTYYPTGQAPADSTDTGPQSTDTTTAEAGNTIYNRILRYLPSGALIDRLTGISLLTVGIGLLLLDYGARLQ